MMNEKDIQVLERKISELKSDRKNTIRNAGRIKALESRLKTAKIQVKRTLENRQR